jgi:hypothetical protein
MYEFEVLTFTAGWRGHDYAKIQDELNEFGRQGWRVAGNHDTSVASNVPTEIVVILERPLPAR